MQEKKAGMSWDTTSYPKKNDPKGACPLDHFFGMYYSMNARFPTGNPACDNSYQYQMNLLFTQPLLLSLFE